MASLFEQINERLGVANLRQVEGEKFAVIEKVPEWLLKFRPDLRQNEPFSLPETFLFFDSFLDEIRQILARDPDELVNSGPWSEADNAGAETHLSATGLLVDGHIVIQLKLIDDSRRYHQAVFQKAREYSMGYERLMKERERREVLLHTIVHDLSGPLTTIYGALEMLEMEPHRGQLLKLALKQCDVEKQMIQSILETFSADFAPFDRDSVSWNTAPILREVLQAQIERFQPSFEAQGVNLELRDETPGEIPIRVFAEAEFLERVLSNLLENALRFSPRDTTTRIELKGGRDHYTVAVCDQGEGVADSIRERLFDRFSGGQRFGGKAGLGLYFCRITVERWGETIRCEPLFTPARPDGRRGTRMVFTLTGVSPGNSG